VDFYYNRAAAFSEKGDLDRAIEDWTNAIGLDRLIPGTAMVKVIFGTQRVCDSCDQ
jgi:Tetratricopeptide repeat